MNLSSTIFVKTGVGDRRADSSGLKPPIVPHVAMGMRRVEGVWELSFRGEGHWHRIEIDQNRIREALDTGTDVLEIMYH